MCMKLHRNVFFLENGWRNVGGVMKSFFCNHKKILFEHRLVTQLCGRRRVLAVFAPNIRLRKEATARHVGAATVNPNKTSS